MPSGFCAGGGGGGLGRQLWSARPSVNEGWELLVIGIGGKQEVVVKGVADGDGMAGLSMCAGFLEALAASFSPGGSSG